MVSEASKPQHLVYGRVAHRALRRTNLGAPPTSQRPRFTNSKRRKADGKFFASQPLGIAQNRKRISEALTAQRPRSTNSTREKAARKKLQKKGKRGKSRGERGFGVGLLVRRIEISGRGIPESAIV